MIPSATYRVQLTPDFTLDDAAGLVPYLADLGISHIFCSPWLQATPKSAHGYDVVNHRAIALDLGGAPALAALFTATKQHGLGIVLDIVPNHMHVPNPMWDDVRRRGADSPFACWFDVDGDLAGVDPGAADDPDPRAGMPPYRRFFDIDSLAAVRVEDPGVFGATHDLVLQLTRAGVIDGLRVDHVDGLTDPSGYLAVLAEATDGRWVVVEKILATGERLPPPWRCAGTTGYDALAAVTGLFLDPGGAQPLTATYGAFIGAEPDWDSVALQARRDAIASLRPEVDRLARVVSAHVDAVVDVRDAVVELLVAMPVYRLDISPDRAVSPQTRAELDTAVSNASKRQPDLTSTMQAIASALLTGPGELAARFGQTSGPVMAKGQEDTAFYRYHLLASLCEVGSDPDRFGCSLDDFHDFATHLATTWPSTMTTLSTHDTKRSEDVRARLAVLSEIPDEWRTAVLTWSAAAGAYRGLAGPDPNAEYLFWQTLVGAWPLTTDRATAYLTKATREAKQHTGWVDPDPEYDAAIVAFVTGVLGDRALLADVAAFVARIERAAFSNMLAQKLTQLTMPGVPDVYQGNESRRFDLVDPDNRRTVDFATLRTSLADQGDTKQRVVATTLRLRRAHPEWFGAAAAYLPLRADGAAADHVVAFARGSTDAGFAVTAVPRFTERLEREGGWRDTSLTLPPGSYRDVLSGVVHTGRVNLAQLFGALPVTLLVPQSEQPGQGDPRR